MVKIGLDIGHGDNTFPPSKGLYKNGKGYAEHDFNSKLGKRIKQLLEENGHTVILGQQPNAQDVALRTRTNLYNRENVDLVVSIHANANANSGVNGRCVFYWHSSASGKKLAQSIINEFKAKGYSTHGNGLHASIVGSWTNLHITRETKAPAVLIEHGFMTGSQDFDLIFGNKQAEYIEDMAQADVAGIIKYLGGKPVAPSKPSKPAPAPKPKSKPKPSAPSKPKPKTPSTTAAKLIKNEKSKYTVTTSAGIKVRNAPSTTAKHTGTLPKGASINYDSVYEGNGYRWLSYIGGSGNRLYLPYRPLSGKNEVWGTFGSTPKPATPKAKTLHLPASAKLWKVYKPNGPYTSGNEIHNLTPAAYGGLIYDIKGNPTPHVYLIDTGVKGRVAIYAHPNTGAIIK